MRHEIVLAPEAVEDLKKLDADHRAIAKHGLETHLRHEPEKLSRVRIKRLRGVRRPAYRLRIGEVRVFYDVTAGSVEVLATVPKAQAGDWLREWGEAE